MSRCNTAALVACGKDKSEKREIVWKLYDGTLTELSMAAAMLTGDPYILSAKHGLVAPHERLEPYDKSLYEMSEGEKNIWGRKVAEELPKYGNVVFFAPSEYKEYASRFLDSTIDVYWPYRGLSGNGMMMKRAKKIASYTHKK